MATKWNNEAMSFSSYRRRRVRADFSGGLISSRIDTPNAYITAVASIPIHRMISLIARHILQFLLGMDEIVDETLRIVATTPPSACTGIDD